MTLYLVRHGRPLIDPEVPAAQWSLDPAHHDDVLRLRRSGRLPDGALWFSSTEPKAVQTARLLTDTTVPALPDLCEVRRPGRWVDDFEAAVLRGFADPDTAPLPGWESCRAATSRLTRCLNDLRTAEPGRDLVLVGHGTAWILLAATVSGTEPDVRRWQRLAMPDLIVVDHR